MFFGFFMFNWDFGQQTSHLASPNIVNLQGHSQVQSDRLYHTLNPFIQAGKRDEIMDDGHNSSTEYHSESSKDGSRRSTMSSEKSPAVATSSPPCSTGGTNGTQPSTSSTSSCAIVDDTTIAQALQMVEALTAMYGFEYDVANEAVNVVGGTDITVCCDYILDRGLGKDTGGAIAPIDTCPHLNHAVCVVAQDVPIDFTVRPCCYIQDKFLRGRERGEMGSGWTDTGTVVGRLKEDVDDITGACPMGENWLCLKCSKVYCSRYVNGHGLQHWHDTCGTNNNNNDDDDDDNDTTTNDDEHCVMVSLTDLSVWCHRCASYLRHESLRPIIQRLEEIKFKDSETMIDQVA
jgi:hypothetical protein